MISLHLSAEIAVQDPSALLIFSGGMTRPASTLSEAMSYYRLAKAGNIYSHFMTDEQKGRGEEFQRVTTEASPARGQGGR